MRHWFVFLVTVSCLIAQVPAEWKLVSVADHAELYEIEKSGEITFTLRNQMDVQVERYVVEVRTKGPAGDFTLSCSIVESHVAIGKEPQTLNPRCQLPVDPHTGRAILHSSRIVELDWERGLRWRPSLTIAAHPRS